MIRFAFYCLAVVALLGVAAWGWFWTPAWWIYLGVGPLVGLGLYDVFSRHNVLSNYPVIGHARYMLEFIRPELRQYFFESETDGQPFSREQRTIINARADGKGDTHPFGTIREFERPGFVFAEHSIAVKDVGEGAERVLFGGPQCEHPYNASRLNISTMSFGSLSSRAILAMNYGAALGGFAQDTGEGGLSPYHLEYDADEEEIQSALERIEEFVN